MAKSKKPDHRQRLTKLRELVESLHDRDEQLKRDLKMFENFIETDQGYPWSKDEKRKKSNSFWCGNDRKK